MTRTESCPSCSHDVDASAASAGFLKCDACGMRFPRPRRRRAKRKQTDELDIHPALRERYAARETPPTGLDIDDMPSVQLSPSLMEETDEPRVEQRPPRSERPRTERPIEKKTRAIRGSLEEREPTSPVERAKEGPQLPVLPGLKILEQVGKGAMGAVYRAVEEGTDRPVAVKVLAPELAARPDFIARFEREAAALARVRHPGVVSTLRSGKTEAPMHGAPIGVGASEDGAHHFLCMKFVEGGSLRRTLDKGPLAPGRALRFARQVAQGLGAAHDVGVIHRDLKPENILVTDDEGEERLVLVDFGLAGITDESEDPHPNLTKSRMTMGTVNYMAPEQRTDAKRVDHRADLYAAGVILYELLTGDLPLGRFALPTERGHILPAAVDEVIVRALARAPDERYQSAHDFDRDLRAIQDELSQAADRDTLVGQTANVTRVAFDEGAPTIAHVRSDLEIAESEVSARELEKLAPTPEPAHSPEWHTAPPWVKRPELVWGVLALVAGAVVGIAVGPGAILEKAAPEGPALVASADGFGPAIAPGARWSASTTGWSSGASGARFSGSADDGFAIALGPIEDQALSVSASVRGRGGIAILDERGERGAFLEQNENGCRAARFQKGAPPELAVAVPCGEQLTLACEAGWCRAQDKRIEVPTLVGRARPALVCTSDPANPPGATLSCAFNAE